MGNQKGVIMARKRYSAEQIIGHLRQAEILISEGKTIIEARSEEHTSELQSRTNLVCRLLLEKKNYSLYHLMHMSYCYSQLPFSLFSPSFFPYLFLTC